MGTIGGSDGRPRWDPSDNAVNDLNPFDDFSNGALYVLDKTDEGYHTNITVQLRKKFENGLNRYCRKVREPLAIKASAGIPGNSTRSPRSDMPSGVTSIWVR